MNVGSLCTGYGGLDLAVEAVFGNTRLAWVSDIEPGPCAVLAHRYPDVPNLGDLTTCDWSTVEPVDILTAGYPCQPFSYAGQRKGTDDARHLWPFISHAIGVLRPRIVVLENVAGHLSLGGTTVIGGLTGLGYDARWRVVRASDVGACHQRARWFCVATDTERLGQQPRPRLRTDEPASVGRGRPGDDDGAATPNADSERLEGLAGIDVAPGESEVASFDWRSHAAAIARHEQVIGRPAPEPVDDRGRLNPVFVEWMMMLPEGHVTDVLTTRTKALKCLGNGVVPAQAAHALRLLIGAAA